MPSKSKKPQKKQKEEAIARGRLAAKGAKDAYDNACKDYLSQNQITFDSFKTVVDSSALVLISNDTILDTESYLALVDMLGHNRAGIKNRISEIYKAAKGADMDNANLNMLINSMVLEYLSKAMPKQGEAWDPIAKVAEVVNDIDKYMQSMNRYESPETRLNQHFDSFKKGDYLTALSGYYEDQNLIESIAPTEKRNAMKIKMWYAQGSILLWNLGNVEKSKNLVTNDGFREEIDKRKENGNKYLMRAVSEGKKMKNNKEIEDIIAAANQVMHKYYASK
jgi:hypothetical protein